MYYEQVESVRTLCRIKRDWAPVQNNCDNYFHLATRLDAGHNIRILYDSGHTDVDACCKGNKSALCIATARGAVNAQVTLHVLGSNAHFDFDSLNLPPASYYSLANINFQTEATEYNMKNVQRVRRLYYLRSLSEVLFFAQTQRAS